MEWTSIDLSSKLSLTCGGDVNYYNKCSSSYSYFASSYFVSKLSFQFSVSVCSLLGQSEGEREAFLERCKKGETLVY